MPPQQPGMPRPASSPSDLWQSSLNARVHMSSRTRQTGDHPSRRRSGSARHVAVRQRVRRSGQHTDVMGIVWPPEAWPPVGRLRPLRFVIGQVDPWHVRVVLALPSPEMVRGSPARTHDRRPAPHLPRLHDVLAPGNESPPFVRAPAPAVQLAGVRRDGQVHERPRCHASESIEQLFERSHLSRGRAGVCRWQDERGPVGALPVRRPTPTYGRESRRGLGLLGKIGQVRSENGDHQSG